MGRSRDRSIAINGRMYHIQYFESDNLIVWGVVIGLAFFIWTRAILMFNMPDEQDLNSERYREEANKTAIAMIVDSERKAWIERGFVETSPAPKAMKIGGKDFSLSKNIVEVTKYFGNGLYQVYTGTDVELNASSEDKKVTTRRGYISKECIVTIKTTPKRNWYGTVELNWKISDIKWVNSTKSEADITKILKNWEIPQSQKPSW